MENVCIVGYGAIGPIHAEALMQIDNAKLYAVCDINQEMLERCMRCYNIKTYVDFDQMLLDDNINSVHICTPHYLHYGMIKKALQFGKKVVCEKPVTRTVKEFDEILKLPSSNKVCVILQNRYNPCVAELKRLIDIVALGKIKAVKGLVTWHRSAEYYKNGDWRGKWDTEGGSVLINQAVHTLDLMIYLAGNIKSLNANVQNYSLKDVIETEDTVMAYLKFENGFNGIFFASNAYGVDSDPEIEVVGEKAVARYAYKKLTVNGELVAEDILQCKGKNYWGNGHEAFLRDYYDNKKSLMPKDIKNTMDTLFGIYESAKNSGEEVHII